MGLKSFVVRVATSRWVRRTAYVSVGLAMFLLGSTFLSLRYEPDIETFVVAGSGHVEAGGRASVRVAAQMADAPTAVPVTVRAVRVQGAAVAFEAADDQPATVVFAVPPDVGVGADVAIDVAAGERTATLRYRAEVLHGNPERRLTGEPEKRYPTDKPFRLELVPAGGALVMGTQTALYLRVRTADGAPVDDAAVLLRHPSLPNGKAPAMTDANGLARFPIAATQPSFRFEVEVAKGDAQAAFERLLIPEGRQIAFVDGPVLLAPGEKGTFSVRTTEAAAPVYCDVTHGPAWIQSVRVSAKQGNAVVPVGPLPEGRYGVQCYLHPHTPGGSYVVRPLWVGQGDAVRLASALATAQGRLDAASALVPAEGRTEITLGYLMSLVDVGPTLPTVLVSTYAEDVAARSERWSDRKTNVLIAIAGVALLVLLVVFEVVLSHVIATRDRLRAYAAELAAEDDAEGGAAPDFAGLDALDPASGFQRERLVTTRGIVMIVILGGTLIANAAGVIFLLSILK